MYDALNMALPYVGENEFSGEVVDILITFYILFQASDQNHR